MTTNWMIATLAGIVGRIKKKAWISLIQVIIRDEAKMFVENAIITITFGAHVFKPKKEHASRVFQ